MLVATANGGAYGNGMAPCLPETEFRATVGHSLRRARMQKGWQLWRLAEESGVALENISNIETAKRGCTAYTLYRLACALDVSLDSLLA
jgi:transcriptional regulator with XRE-family HTH domain